MIIFKKSIAILLILISFTNINNNFYTTIAKASVTKVVNMSLGPFDDNGPHEQVISLPNLKDINSVTTDTGAVSIKSVNNDQVVLTVSGGTPDNMMTLSKHIQIDIPLVNTDQDGFTENDLNTMSEEYITIDTEGNKKILPYPRYNNWYEWVPNPNKLGTYMWGTVPNGYGDVGIKYYGDNIYNNLINKSGEYADSEGYKVPYSQFKKMEVDGWYPRDGGYPGYITSDSRYGLPGMATDPKYEYPCPLGEPSNNTDTRLLGYQYIRVGAYNYTAHFEATALKQVPANGYSYNITITYTTLDVPQCEIIAPDTVTVGDDVFIAGSASSPNGAINSYGWSFYPSANVVGTITGQSGTVYFNVIGTYNINLSVIDEKNMMAYDTKPINVIPPYPSVIIKNMGELKVNRKIIIDASSSTGGSKRFPIDWGKAKWNVTAVSGGTNDDIKIQTHTNGSTDGTILYDSSKGINNSLDSQSTFDVLFKKPGIYKVSSELTNTYGNSGRAEITLNITDDIAPITNFSTPSIIYRDPLDNAPNGYAQATITLTDNGSISDGSYSIDNDIIQKRGYFLVFDSNNNNSYNDDMVYIYDQDYAGTNQIPDNYSVNTHWRPVCLYKDISTINIRNINTGNFGSIIFKSTHVGKYLPGLFVLEEFGQDYIPQFTSINDRKSNYIAK